MSFVIAAFSVIAEFMFGITNSKLLTAVDQI